MNSERKTTIDWVDSSLINCDADFSKSFSLKPVESQLQVKRLYERVEEIAYLRSEDVETEAELDTYAVSTH
jgi:hypothetical protein